MFVSPLLSNYSQIQFILISADCKQHTSQPACSLPFWGCFLKVRSSPHYDNLGDAVVGLSGFVTILLVLWSMKRNNTAFVSIEHQRLILLQGLLMSNDYYKTSRTVWILIWCPVIVQTSADVVESDRIATLLWIQIMCGWEFFGFFALQAALVLICHVLKIHNKLLNLMRTLHVIEMKNMKMVVHAFSSWETVSAWFAASGLRCCTNTYKLDVALWDENIRKLHAHDEIVLHRCIHLYSAKR